MNIAHSLTVSFVTLASIRLLLSPSQTESQPPASPHILSIRHSAENHLRAKKQKTTLSPKMAVATQGFAQVEWP
jgi:hypothetical protein